MQDLNELNKTQIILLVLFVSFVTSIVTGIVTVTLLDQAPPGVTQTINRVVEHTIEKVVPTTQTQVKEVQVQVVTTAEELIVKTVAQARPALLSIGDHLGFLIGADGLYATTDPDHQLAVLKTKEGSAPGKFPGLALATTTPALGSTVIVPGQNSVSVGILTGLLPAASATSTISIKISVSDGLAGAPVLNTKGGVIGMIGQDGGVLPSALIAQSIPALDSSSKSQ